MRFDTLGALGDGARGAKRIVFSQGGELVYYSWNHYAVGSFELLYDSEQNVYGPSEDYRAKYNVLLANVEALAKGGTVSDYMIGGVKDGRYVMGYRTNSYDVSRNQSALGAIDGARSALQTYREDLNNLVYICGNADRDKEHIKEKVEALRRKLDTTKCSEEVKNGIREKLAEYDKLLLYDIKPMAEDMQVQDGPVLAKLKSQLDTMGYGDPNRQTGGYTLFYTFSRLAHISGEDGFIIDQSTTGNHIDLLREIDMITPVTYDSPGTFLKFQEISEDNRVFYEYLEKLFEGDQDGKKEDQIRENVADVMEFQVLQHSVRIFRSEFLTDPTCLLRDLRRGEDPQTGQKKEKERRKSKRPFAPI